MRQNILLNIAELSANKIKNTKINESFFYEPFQYLFIDDFLPIEIAESCCRSFPSLKDSEFWDYKDDQNIEVKYRSRWSNEFDIPDGLIDAVRILNSSLVLKEISEKFSIDKLMPDPYFTGGGLNVTQPGGLLDVHVDGNYHDASGLNRRINAILYFNPGWEKEWGGEFGIYDNSGQICLKKIAPLFNRLVIFDTHDFSYHGLPDPLNFPEGEIRKSLILYYYSIVPRPTHLVETNEPHSALWVKNNYHDKLGKKNRNFK